MSFNVIVTVGPSCLSSDVIKQIESIGPCIFRINSSHLKTEQIQDTIQKVRSFVPRARIMVDLPGNKIRTSDNFVKRGFRAGENFQISSGELNYAQLMDYLSEGDVLFTNDSLNSLVVREIDNAQKIVIVEAQEDGQLSKNKGIHVRSKKLKLPFLFKKDIEIIQLLNNSNADYLALSFVRNAEDIEQAKKLLTNHNVKIISKVEKSEAIENLDSILDCSDSILIDRGDLSNDAGMLSLPFYQDFIIQKARLKHKNVFLATQFLKYMEINRIPLIAEIMGLYNDIKEGVAGIQLSEETAIGQYPVECVKLVFDMHIKVNRAVSQGACLI